ncbi:alpha/beta hydrolase [Undibacterium sp. SXout7W]|uniref:alpha/beta hydrolase n=1 Tax=Undibacterium sp. SXout7W TaxID=3413049 RepID=UPI003BF154BC
MIYSSTLYANGVLFKIPTRPEVKTTLFWEPVEQAKATVVLFPGSGGGFGKIENGKPGSNNFLVRSESYFTSHQFNVAIFGRPSDSDDLGYADRISDSHMVDVQEVLKYVKTLSSAPLWIIGTSRGSVSATATAIKYQDIGIAGLVLTSSIVNIKKTGAVNAQELSAIRVPTLVLHHQKDACVQCPPSAVPSVIRGLVNAPAKKLVFVDGGGNPSGDVCAGNHWHGFIGMEKEAVQIISDWIIGNQ